MKVLVIVAALAALSKGQITDEQRNRIRRFREECTQETNVDPKLIDRADRGDFVDDNNLKCFAKCFYMRAGFMNEDAELQIDVIKSKIPSESNRNEALEIIEKCRDVKGSDSCDTAYAIHKCYFEIAAKENQQKEEEAKKNT